jgi:hypothetical protein
LLTPVWNAVHRLIASRLASSHHVPDPKAQHRTMQPPLSALQEIGYLLPGSLGHPTTLLYQERTRRDTLIWHAA